MLSAIITLRTNGSAKSKIQTMKGILQPLVLIIFFSCSSNEKVESTFGKPIAYEQTGFEVTCGRLIKTLDNTHGSHFYIEETKKSIEWGTLNTILYDLMSYEIKDGSLYDSYKKTCNGIEIYTWKSRTNKSITTRIEKSLFQIENENKILITDFNIYRVAKPNHIYLRVINDYTFEKLKIDGMNYNALFEETLVGLDEAIKILDSLKNICR